MNEPTLAVIVVVALEQHQLLVVSHMAEERARAGALAGAVGRATKRLLGVSRANADGVSSAATIGKLTASPVES